MDVYGHCPFLTSDGWTDRCLRLHLVVWNYHVAFESGKVDHRTKISCLLGDQKQLALVSEGCHIGDPLYGPLQQASTSCWRSCRLFLVRKLMHWWVSWGLWWKVMPTPSSTMPVARMVPSRLLHCGAKSARWAPTWTPSTPTSWGSWRSFLSLAALIWVGSMAGSPAGASSYVTVLCTVVAAGEPRRSKTEVLDCFFQEDDVTFVLVLVSLGFWANVTDELAILSACKMALTQFCGSLGSEPRTWGPSNGAVLTVLKTWGWKPKFLSKASLRRSWRLDAAANPAETAETWASWIMANFSRSNSDLWSFVDSSSITDATIESAKGVDGWSPH